MKKTVSIMLVLALILSVCITFAFADTTNDKPAFEKIGLNYRTINLSEHSGEQFKYVTQRANSTESVECQVTADWTTVFDPEVGYGEYMTSFYVPEGVFPENVQFSGSAPMFENIDGYEWRCIRLVIAAPRGIYASACFEDYYTLQQYDEEGDITVEETGDNDFVAYGKFSVNYNEKECSNCYMYCDWEDEKEGNIHLMIINVFYRIPCGYDGCVLSLIDTRNAAGQSTGYIESDTVKRGASDYYFRMK